MNDDLLESINELYDQDSYPEEFAGKYVLMECLAERNGVDTFLAQDHEGSRFIAKCYDRAVWDFGGKSDVLEGITHPGLPGYADSFQNEKMSVVVREYIDGVSLNRYVKERELSEKEIVGICLQLCDILSFLHHRENPIIHRDIKPQNVIIRPDGSAVLIDFDIARIYQAGRETDTRFFGTRAYAPPEQYGFSQTDARTDIYSFGVLLRYLLTGSPRENRKVRLYRPLEKIIEKCTAFAPKDRYSDIDQVKKALLTANPKSQRIKKGIMAMCTVLAAAALVFAGIKIYQKVTWTPFTADAIPAYQTSEEQIRDAVGYMKEKYHTDLFEGADDIATIGLLRSVLIDLYGLDRDYVYGINTEMPQESDKFFLPWGWDDGQTVDRDPAVYAAVKVHDPSIVADWSSIKDDNGFYPGVRVAVAFAEKNGILTGANQPLDISKGELALIFANTDRVFETAKK